MIDLDNGTVMLWGTGDEQSDLTTVEDTARFTARLATDPVDVSGVRYLSGARTTFNEIQPGDAPAYWNFGTYWRLLAGADTTRGRSTTFDELFPEGVVAPPHVHDRAEEAFFVMESDLVFTLGDDNHEIVAPPGSYVYIPPGTRHSFRCCSTVGRVYNTLVPGGFDHGITANGTPAPRVHMPPPGVSALEVWNQVVSGRPAAPWHGQHTTDVRSW